VGYFLGFEILAGLRIAPRICRQILQLCARELAFVGVAQMQDLYNGASRSAVKDSEILKLYLYKTGRYTFSLPLMVGALLAGSDGQSSEAPGKDRGVSGYRLPDQGRRAGFVRRNTGDRQAGGFRRPGGEENAVLQLPVQESSGPERERLSEIFGNTTCGPEQLQYVRDLTTRLGIREAVSATASGLAQKARALIGSLPTARQEDRQILLSLLDYTQTRSR